MHLRRPNNMPPTSNDLLTSTKWDGSNETHNDYKIWMNEVSLWANTNDMAWIMKIAKRLREAPSFRRPGSRAPPIGEKFLDEAQAARKQLLAEIQRSADTDSARRSGVFVVCTLRRRILANSTPCASI